MRRSRFSEEQIAHALRQLAADRATAFATGDAVVRRRALSRAAAVQDVLVQQLSAHLTLTISQHRHDTARMLDRMLNSATARYRSLLDQLRCESFATRRAAILAKGSVAISAEEQLP